MREALFIKQNSGRWREYESCPASDPDKLAERFIAITDDLAYAKTFYPKSKTTAYLNKLAADFHQGIYKNKKEDSSRIVRFWKYELPYLFLQYRRQLLYSLAFFVSFVFIGILSAKYDDTFVRLILGDGYVNMTNANIAKGDPFGVYKDKDSLLMFLAIARNNLNVTALCFVSGILFSIGPLYVLFKNGIMLGAFEYLFIGQGLGIASTLVIWIHGTIEISCIVIAGAAGLILGNSILFPGTYSRMTSMRRGAMDGMKIMIGISPLIVTAAILESYVTRHTDMPVGMSVSILACSAIFMIWYVCIYPRSLKKNLNLSFINNNETQSNTEPDPDIQRSV